MMTRAAAAVQGKTSFATAVTGVSDNTDAANDFNVADGTANDLMIDGLNGFYYLHHSDQPNLILVAHPLTGIANYTSWCEAMLMALTAKNKVGFIDGYVVKPPPEDPFHNAWVRCNITVCSWILNSVSQEISESLLYIRSAVVIWEELKDQFHQSNRFRVFQLCKSLAELQQGSLSVTAYLTRLKTLWNELKQFRSDPVCTCGGLRALAETHQEDCIIQFLMGLNESYANIRSQVLMMEPLPSLSKVFSLVVQEERHRTIQLSQFSSESMVIPENSINATLVSGNSYDVKQERRDRFYCTHCKAKGHSKERCYKLIGYPPGFKSRARSGSNQSSSNTDLVAQVHQTSVKSNDSLISDHDQSLQSLSTGQFQQLLSILNSQSQSGISGTKDPQNLASISSFSGPYAGQADWDG